jgi:hypothetical protein
MRRRSRGKLLHGGSFDSKPPALEAFSARVPARPLYAARPQIVLIKQFDPKDRAAARVY